MTALNVSSRHLQASAAHPLTHLITKPLLSGRDDAPRQSAASTLRRGFPGHHFTHQDARFAARDATKTTRANARTHRSANVVIRPYNKTLTCASSDGRAKTRHYAVQHCTALRTARTKLRSRQQTGYHLDRVGALRKREASDTLPPVRTRAHAEGHFARNPTTTTTPLQHSL